MANKIMNTQIPSKNSLFTHDIMSHPSVNQEYTISRWGDGNHIPSAVLRCLKSDLIDLQDMFQDKNIDIGNTSYIPISFYQTPIFHHWAPEWMITVITVGSTNKQQIKYTGKYLFVNDQKPVMYSKCAQYLKEKNAPPGYFFYTPYSKKDFL